MGNVSAYLSKQYLDFCLGGAGILLRDTQHIDIDRVRLSD
jgi:hypothetical protein